MTIYEILSLVVSIIALMFALSSTWKSSRVNEGNFELYINERISNTTNRMEDKALLLGQIALKRRKTKKEKMTLEVHRKAFYAAIEGMINAYEEACAKYLDKKVDRNRFIKMYRTAIRQLVENPEYKSFFDNTTSKYNCIVKVYHLWENLEN